MIRFALQLMRFEHIYTLLTADLSPVRIPECDTLELAAELGDVLQHGLGLRLHVPLSEDLRLGVELRVTRVPLGTLRPPPQRLTTETTSLTRTLALAPAFRIFLVSVRAGKCCDNYIGAFAFKYIFKSELKMRLKRC